MAAAASQWKAVRCDMGRFFGTDGIRGIANVAPMTAEMVLEVGRATAYVCKRGRDHRHRIVIGKDTRISGYMMENALTAGICSMGVDVFLVGPMPTPGIAFITHSMRADAGMVISASHNPYQDNGIKIFSREGYKLPDEMEAEIEDLVVSGRIRNIRPTAEQIGKARRIDDAVGRYIVFCKNTFPGNLSLDGLRVVLDCANGATYKVAPIIFSELGAEVLPIHNTPNGVNINAHCGSQYPHDLQAKVLEAGADVGLAFDGDGDRMIAVDEEGNLLDGDRIMVICAKYLKEAGRLAGDVVVVTVMSNFGLHEALREMGIRTEVAPVGDRYVLERMKACGAVLGGESSGHLIFLEHHTTGDGIISALQLLAAMRVLGQPLSVLGRLMRAAPQVMINVEVREKPSLEEIPGVQAAVRRAEEELGERGRILVRYSGTQPLCRVMVESADEEQARRLCREVSDEVRRHLG